MSNPSKARGTAWETKVVTYLQEEGWPNVERRTLSGPKDRGDVAGLTGVIVECKSTNRVELAVWLNEAKTETANAGAEVGVVWAHRKGKASAADGYVLMDGATFARLLKLAGW